MFPSQIMRLRAAIPIVQVDIFNLSAISIKTSPASALVIYQLASSGTGSATNKTNWTWLLNGLNSDYQVRATLISDTTPSGDSLNSWLSLGTTRGWSLNQSGVGTVTSTFLVEIRRVVDSTVIDSAQVTLTATVNSGQ